MSRRARRPPMYSLHRKGVVTRETAAQWRAWRYDEEKSVTEIADREGVSKGTVSRHTHDRPRVVRNILREIQNDVMRAAARQTFAALGHLGGPDDDHYAKLGVQPIEATEAWSLTWPAGVAYHLGEAVAAIARCGTKGQMRRDLEKARWLLGRAIGKLPPT